MILIGRGLDLRKKRFESENVGGSEGESRSEEREDPACAVLRVRDAEASEPELEAKPNSREVGRPLDGGSDVKRKKAAKRAEREIKARQREAEAQQVSGDNSLRDPPVPIPNTEVKPQHADSTWLETAR